MPEMNTDEMLVAFALATLETALFTLALLLPLFLAGSLGSSLASLNTLAGLMVFALLWVSTFYCTYRAVSEVGLSRAGVPVLLLLTKGAWWGGWNGVLLVTAPLCVAALPAALYVLLGWGVQDVARLFFAIIMFGGFGSFVAYVIGSAVGFVAALLTAALWWIAGCLVPPERLQESWEGS